MTPMPHGLHQRLYLVTSPHGQTTVPNSSSRPWILAVRTLHRFEAELPSSESALASGESELASGESELASGERASGAADCPTQVSPKSRVRDQSSDSPVGSSDSS